MYYNSFLILISQFTFQEEGKILICGCEVRVKKIFCLEKWELSVDISRENLPVCVKRSLRSGRKIFLESRNSYLKKVEGTISFVQTIPFPKQYIQYKQYMKNFFESLSLWKNLKLRDSSRQSKTLAYPKQ